MIGILSRLRHGAKPVISRVEREAVKVAEKVTPSVHAENVAKYIEDAKLSIRSRDSEIERLLKIITGNDNMDPIERQSISLRIRDLQVENGADYRFLNYERADSTQLLDLFG